MISKISKTFQKLDLYMCIRFLTKCIVLLYQINDIIMTLRRFRKARMQRVLLESNSGQEFHMYLINVFVQETINFHFWPFQLKNGIKSMIYIYFLNVIVKRMEGVHNGTLTELRGPPKLCIDTGYLVKYAYSQVKVGILSCLLAKQNSHSCTIIL